ncbi:MAG: YdcF family protein [Xanthobacteraceae bacterium]
MTTGAGQTRASRKGSLLLRGLHAAARAAVVLALAVGCGFVWFLSQLESDEARPKNPADGIVVLTGGSSRVSDAVDLLANGYGQRLLISGVHWSNGAMEISRSLPDSKSLLACCVDLDYSAVNTRSNATETKRWVQERGFKSLIVVTSNYHMPRALVELSHSMPDVLLIPFPVIGEKWRDEPWWSSGAAARLLLMEYAKFLVAGVRVQVDEWVPFPEPVASPVEMSRKRAARAVN